MRFIFFAILIVINISLFSPQGFAKSSSFTAVLYPKTDLARDAKVFATETNAIVDMHKNRMSPEVRANMSKMAKDFDKPFLFIINGIVLYVDTDTQNAIDKIHKKVLKRVKLKDFANKYKDQLYRFLYTSLYTSELIFSSETKGYIAYLMISAVLHEITPLAMKYDEFAKQNNFLNTLSKPVLGTLPYLATAKNKKDLRDKKNVYYITNGKTNQEIKKIEASLKQEYHSKIIPGLNYISNKVYKSKIYNQLFYKYNTKALNEFVSAILTLLDINIHLGGAMRLESINANY